MNRLRLDNRPLVVAVCLYLGGIFAAGGCDTPPPVAPGQTAAPQVAAPAAPPRPENDAKPLATAEQRRAELVDREIWDVYYIGGSRIGYGSTRWTVQAGEPELLLGEGKMRLAIRRFGEENVTEVAMSVAETFAGEVRSFDSEARLGQSPTVTHGECARGVMKITQSTGNDARQSEIAWPAGTGGFFAVEEDLLCQPMKPGERRVLRTLLPVFNQVATVELRAIDFEKTDLLDGDQELLRIDTVTNLPGTGLIQAVSWASRDGEVMKTLTRAMDQVVYRTSKEVATRESGEGLDLGDRSLVRLAKPLSDAHRSQEIRYRATLDGDDPAAVFLKDLSQETKAVDQNTAEIIVRAVRPDSPPAADVPASAGAAATDDDRQPNNFVQSDDPTIVQMAKEAVGGEQDPWRQAVILERLVHDKVAAKNYSQTFATAADVAKNLEGDCTEHAVLLAALLRARGIPARVAIGLVYVPTEQAFAFHMWTEAFVKDRWIGLDGTIGGGGIAACYLKLATSSLKDATGLASFLPVAQVLGKLKIEVLAEK